MLSPTVRVHGVADATALASQATLAFPAVLDSLALAPFDVAKLVHPFQAAAPALPAELNRHLFLLEERILEVCVQGSGYRLRSTI